MARTGRPSSAPTGQSPSWSGWMILVLLLGAMWVWQLFGTANKPQPSIDYSQFFSLLESGHVSTVTIAGQTMTGQLKEEQHVDDRTTREFRTVIPSQDDNELFPTLRKQGVNVRVKSEEQPFAVQLLLSLLPWILIIGAWFWLSRRIQKMSPGGPLGNLLKGRTRRFEMKENVRVRFDDVAGLKSAKADLEEIVEFLREPERFRRLGGKVPRGVLLVGPPGTGKTLVARAVAGESGVPFFSINGSEFIELFVGVGAARVRDLFDEAKKSAPA